VTSPSQKPSRFAKLWHAYWVRDNEELDAHDAASTLFRFFRSEHVHDLRLIFDVATFLLFILVVGAIILSLTEFKTAAASLATVVSIYGAILAWTYLTAGKRLGVVDLFACEIATVCRVGTIFDVGRNYIKKYENVAIEVPSLHSTSFVSQEDYFPIFAHNSQDLQALEALVVSHITEFYTYMKATRDLQRKLAQIETVEAAREVTANIIYTLFLGYESGRKAIDHLIEFQPTKNENIIVILLTELECYSFLCKHFKGDDLRFNRLQLREADYEEIPGLWNEVNAPHKKKENEKYWAPAQRMVPELQTRYRCALETVQRCARELRDRSQLNSGHLPIPTTESPPISQRAVEGERSSA
jgi:hypothetical protein